VSANEASLEGLWDAIVHLEMAHFAYVTDELGTPTGSEVEGVLYHVYQGNGDLSDMDGRMAYRWGGRWRFISFYEEAGQTFDGIGNPGTGPLWFDNPTTGWWGGPIGPGWYGWDGTANATDHFTVT
jgi:hypothetical protein